MKHKKKLNSRHNLDLSGNIKLIKLLIKRVNLLVNLYKYKHELS